MTDEIQILRQRNSALVVSLREVITQLDIAIRNGKPASNAGTIVRFAKQKLEEATK